MMNRELPRVLVISSSFFSESSNNGKTLSSFFFGYPKEKIAQLSFSVSRADPQMCSNYFAITISDVLKGRPGKAYSCASDRGAVSADVPSAFLGKAFHYLSEKRLPVTALVKNCIWKHAKLREAYRFIESFSPEVLFFQGFSLSYGYRIALQIAQKYHLPMILELTDDYTARLYKWSLIDLWNHHVYNRLFSEAIRCASSVIVISPRMKAEYDKRYRKESIVMMNSVPASPPDFDNRDEHLFVYAGNIRLNRWKVLLSFSDAIRRIDKDNTLFICTPDGVSPKVRKAFQKKSNIQYGGRLTQDELREKLSRCGSVVHVEAFDRKNQAITRYSLSTKIPEYMASGALITAIGPESIASMEYIRDEDIGICVYSPSAEEMYTTLNTALSDRARTEEMKKNAFEKCLQNHSREKNSESIRDMMMKAATVRS